MYTDPYFGYAIHLQPKRKAQCLKISKKVTFNIVSEASYVYILSGQKLITNAKNSQFDEFLKN